MQYMIMVFESESDFAARSDERATDYWAAWSAYSKAISESGILKGGNALQGVNAATTVQTVKGERVVQDGPFSAAKEQLGGYFIVEVPDLDTAVEWASRVPVSEHGAVELRAVLEQMS